MMEARKRFAVAAASVALVTAFGAGPASATRTAADLVADCNPEDLIRFARCAGYIDGVLDMHSVAVGIANHRPIFCLPATGISIEDGIVTFLQWIKKNPSDLHQSARGIVVIAIAQRYRCDR